MTKAALLIPHFWGSGSMDAIKPSPSQQLKKSLSDLLNQFPLTGHRWCCLRHFLSIVQSTHRFRVVTTWPSTTAFSFFCRCIVARAQIVQLQAMLQNHGYVLWGNVSQVSTYNQQDCFIRESVFLVHDNCLTPPVYNVLTAKFASVIPNTCQKPVLLPNRTKQLSVISVMVINHRIKLISICLMSDQQPRGFINRIRTTQEHTSFSALFCSNMK